MEIKRKKLYINADGFQIKRISTWRVNSHRWTFTCSNSCEEYPHASISPAYIKLWSSVGIFSGSPQRRVHSTRQQRWRSPEFPSGRTQEANGVPVSSRRDRLNNGPVLAASLTTAIASVLNRPFRFPVAILWTLLLLLLLNRFHWEFEEQPHWSQRTEGRSLNLIKYICTSQLEYIQTIELFL